MACLSSRRCCEALQHYRHVRVDHATVLADLLPSEGFDRQVSSCSVNPVLLSLDADYLNNGHFVLLSERQKAGLRLSLRATTSFSK